MTVPVPTVMIREGGHITKRRAFKSNKKASRFIDKLRAKGFDVLFFML